MATSGLTHVRWSEVAAEPLTDAIRRRYINTGRMTIARFELSRGGVVPRHSHEHEQVTTVLSGALKFVTPGAEVTVRQSESITIAPWVEHRVDVLEDTVVIDVFCPVRQDWVTKADDYFKRAAE
jgi:quercetin dioxygenase-like cupin family protein